MAPDASMADAPDDIAERSLTRKEADYVSNDARFSLVGSARILMWLWLSGETFSSLQILSIELCWSVRMPILLAGPEDLRAVFPAVLPAPHAPPAAPQGGVRGALAGRRRHKGRALTPAVLSPPQLQHLRRGVSQ
jgi:hypothetical protein